MAESIAQKSLVVIFGAGASKEVGLPLGAELTKEIASTLRINETEYGAVRPANVRVFDAMELLSRLPGGLPGNMGPYIQAAHDIREGMSLSPSIDNFIDVHRDNPKIAECGKLAITHCILNAESRSKLHVDRSNVYNTINFDELDSTWFNDFFRLLTENCHKNELEARLRKVTLIVFNYDRCIEHFIHSALQRLYRESADWATGVMAALDIYHPYGRVGALPWMKQGHSAEFGGDATGAGLIALSRDLLTFSEGTDARKSDIECIRRDVAHAERLAFMGFAFHRLNLSLLFDKRPGINENYSRPIYASAYKLSDSDREAISQAITSLSGRQRDRYFLRGDVTCAGLMREFARGLSLV